MIPDNILESLDDSKTSWNVDDMLHAFLWGWRIGMYEACIAKSDDERQAIYSVVVELHDVQSPCADRTITSFCKSMQRRITEQAKLDRAKREDKGNGTDAQT